MIEHLFYCGYPSGLGSGRKFSSPTSQQDEGVWRLTAMRQQLPLPAATARYAAMVVLAMLLILVILPAMLAAQAASLG